MIVVHDNTAIVAQFYIVDEETGQVVDRQRPQYVIHEFKAESFLEAFAWLSAAQGQLEEKCQAP